MLRYFFLTLVLLFTGFAQVSSGQESQSPGDKMEKQSGGTSTATVPHALGQELVGEGDVIRIKANLVTVPARVMDKDGRYVTNLRQENFEIFEDGIPQQIAFFAPAEEPFSILFLVDVSGSMIPYTQNLERAVGGFFAQLRPNDRVSAFSFFQFVNELIPSTTVSDLHTAIKFKVRHDDDCPTYLYDAVDNALERIKKLKGRKAIVLFTDGDGIGFSATAKSTLRKAEEQEALIYTVQFRNYLTEPSRFVNKKFYLERVEQIDGYLEDLARKTGGRHFKVADISNFAETFRPIADELRRQYTLGYYPRKQIEAGERRQIRVKVNLPNLAVKSRDSYIAKN